MSVTPSGGWVPAVIAGHTGVGLSQRAQSFVTRAEDGPFNVIEPGKRPRVTLTPTLAMKDGAPYLAFAVQGGDSQDQNLLQFFLNIVEFGMTPQQAAEAPNINSYQMRSSFGAARIPAGRHARLLLDPGQRADRAPAAWATRWSSGNERQGRSTRILFDRAHGTMWGGVEQPRRGLRRRVVASFPDLRLTYIGGPTLLIEVGGLRLLTDPTFDPAGAGIRQGAYELIKTEGPAMRAESVGHIDAVLLSHDHHFDNLDDAGRVLLASADRVLTTEAGAERLGGRAQGVPAWQSVESREPAVVRSSSPAPQRVTARRTATVVPSPALR